MAKNMENVGSIALSAQMALSRKLEAVANNIANADTTGFKSQSVLFKEELSKADKNEKMSLVLDYGEYKDLTNGPITQTGGTLDVALEGSGFLAVQTPDGEKYTRNGRMSINNQSQLVTSFGAPVLDQGGQAITLPANSKDISISQSGVISTKAGILATLKIVKFANSQTLEPEGNSLFKAPQGGAVADLETKVYQGAVEGSNVNSINETTEMIDVSRRYQAVARLLQTDSDQQTETIRRLAKLN
jgi:flagellar basal-body rod protein FlgF